MIKSKKLWNTFNKVFEVKPRPAKMFFDLNVQLLDERTLSAVVEMLIRLGYDGCAINQVSKGRFPPSLVNKAAGNFFKKSVFLMYFA